MNLKTMLARFESSLGCHGLAEEMVLLPEPKTRISRHSETAKSVNLIVGYSGSANSQIALDITLWIAHQTRLATTKEVTVQVVYVIDNSYLFAWEKWPIERIAMSDFAALPTFNCAAPTMPLSAANQSDSRRENWLDRPYLPEIFSDNNDYEVADKLLWEARCLAEEWRGLLKAHLRIGQVAAELRKVVESEAANVLFLGCNSVNHPLLRALSKNFPCCVLGIPAKLASSMDFQPEVSSSKLQLAVANS